MYLLIAIDKQGTNVVCDTGLSSVFSPIRAGVFPGANRCLPQPMVLCPARPGFVMLAKHFKPSRLDTTDQATSLTVRHAQVETYKITKQHCHTKLNLLGVSWGVSTY